MREWLRMIESLRHAPEWATDEQPIEVVQTHISAVLLGEHHVLKLKKPVDFGFLDYTTLEKRLRACEMEINLNRRLCPDIYLGVQPVVEIQGQMRLAHAESIVDYGVWMKRLPADHMLDRMVADETVTEIVIERIAERLNAFHRTARRDAEVDLFGSLETIRYNWEENFTQTAPYINRTISASEFDLIRAWVHRWLEANEDLLNERVRQGCICDGHGDVRCESICITNGICIFDCIEFNERFRCADVANEAAFLAMDLDVRGRPDLGYYFTECYSEQSGDAELFRLLPFYRCYRAFVRGKVLSFQLDEPELKREAREAAARQAKDYFELAARYARRLRTPTVIAVAGFSGTGKTSVARAIAGELGLRVVSSDAVRKSLFGDGEEPSGYGEGMYSDEANRLTYRRMVEMGRGLLKQDGGVILDATFRRAADREAAREMAESVGAQWRLIECRLSPDLVRRRLDLRAARKDGLSDATWQTYERQRAEFECDKIADAVHLALDTGEGLSVSSRQAADWLRSNDGQSPQRNFLNERKQDNALSIPS